LFHLRVCAHRFAAEIQFLLTDQGDLGRPVLPAKYCGSLPAQISSTSFDVLSHKGRLEIVTDGAGCGGRGVRIGERAGPRTAKSCGPDAPTLAPSWREQFHLRQWQTSPVVSSIAPGTNSSLRPRPTH
jgi:hypothetical protein